MVARQATGGPYIYPIDDAYIHLALAKNLALHGTYGLYPDAFTAASSSIGWPLLLGAVYKLYPSTNVVWMISTAFAAMVPVAVGRALAALSPRPLPISYLIVVQALVLVATPLGPLAVSGMEHTAHALATILLATEVARERAPVKGTRTGSDFAMGALSMASTLLRYESLALVAVCVLLLLRGKNLRGALAVALGGALAPALFAHYSRAHGWQSLPNSVILKGRRWDAETPQVILNNLREAPHLVVLFAVLSAALVAMRARAAPPTRRFGLIALAVLVAHVLCGGVGWFYRYEAYVIPVTLVAIALLLASVAGSGANSRADYKVLALALPLVLLLPRGFSALRALPQASRNIYDEQVRTARFVQENFDREPVLLNDIGAVAYFSNAPFVDLMGLANQETARARGMRIDRPMGRGALEKLSEHADVAVVYEEWFRAEMPGAWEKIGEFRTEHNRVCAFPAVSVFATKPQAVARVRAAFIRSAQATPGDK